MLPKNRWKITRNQIPVVNLLVPIFIGGVEGASLVVLKKQGRLMLPGGYLESGKDWQRVCLDVCRYEIRVRMEEGSRFWPIDCFTSTHKSVFALFAQSPSLREGDLLNWKKKSDERILLNPGDHQLAFDHHTEMVRRFFRIL